MLLKKNHLSDAFWPPSLLPYPKKNPEVFLNQTDNKPETTAVAMTTSPSVIGAVKIHSRNHIEGPAGDLAAVV